MSVRPTAALVGAVFVATIATPLVAGCAAATTTVLSCQMRGGKKELDVCIDGATISYRFGAPGAPPDLELSVPVATVEHQPWLGVGRSIWETTTFTNNAFDYEVYITVDRLTDEHPIESGLTVYKDGAPIGEFVCDDGTDTIGLWEVADAKNAAGVCWKPDDYEWGDCD